MKTLLISCVVVATGWLAPLSQAQVFSENFNGQTPGANPTGFTSVSPSTATPTNGATVVALGSGDNAVNMYDYSTTANARVEEDFTAMSSAHLSLSFTRNANITPAGTTSGFYLALGTFGASQGTSANRALDIRLYNDGTYRFERASQNPDGTFGVVSLTGAATFEPAGTTYSTHTLDIFAYGGTTGGSTLSYTGPDAVARILDPHSYAVYIDGALAQPSAANLTANGDYGFYTSSFYSSTDLGRFGFVTGGASNLPGMDFLVDNIVLSTIPVPEPSTCILFGVGGLLVLWTRRTFRVTLPGK
jgi:hypothetical protein